MPPSDDTTAHWSAPHHTDAEQSAVPPPRHAHCACNQVHSEVCAIASTYWITEEEHVMEIIYMMIKGTQNLW